MASAWSRRLLEPHVAPLQGVDVQEGQPRRLDPVVRGDVGPDPQRVPPPLAVLGLVLPGRDGIDHLGHQARQVVHVEVRAEVAERPADVAADQVQDLLGRRGEPPDPQLAIDHHDRQAHALDEVGEIVVEPAELDIAVLAARR